MTFGELKERVQYLSAYDTSEFQENIDLFISSANMALKDISADVKGIDAGFDIVQDGTGAYSYKCYVLNNGVYELQTVTGANIGVAKYNLEDLTIDSTGKKTFEKLEGASLITRDDITADMDLNVAIRKFKNYKLILDKIVAIDAELEGTITFNYKKKVPRIYDTFSDDSDLPIHPEVEHLLPDLTAFYFLIDDDSTKAFTYYNDYDSAKSAWIADNSKTNTQNVTGTVRTDLW